MKPGCRYKEMGTNLNPGLRKSLSISSGKLKYV